MTYAYLDDNFADHPKIVTLTDGAFRLHTAGILYANRHLTDGIIQADVVPRLTPRYRRTQLTELIDRLLWAELGDGQAYEIHDFLDWNKSRADVEQLREWGRKGAQKRWHGNG
jgi:hypothetical protein